MYPKAKFTLSILFCVAVLALVVALSFRSVNASQIDISGPAGSGTFGTRVAVLPTGNIVITDPTYDLSGPTVVDVGAVYLYNGLTGAMISVITGSRAGDRVGDGGITVLTNGNYVFTSGLWDGSAPDVGAATLCNGSTGCSGVVSPANSLVGSTSGDGVGGTGVTALTNGNYVVRSSGWDGTAINVGAVTWCSGTIGCAGMVVSASNSLVGSMLGDSVGSSNARALNNGNYVVGSSDWNSATASRTGASTWCSGITGCIGVVSPTNSLVGASNSDFVGGNGITELTDGNYTVSSPSFGGQPSDVGAVTWCSGTAGVRGDGFRKEFFGRFDPG